MNQQHFDNEQLVDYLHRELDPAQDAAILAHLETCAECRARYEAEARLSEVLRGHARASERDLPQGVVARIWDAVDRDAVRPNPWERFAALLRPIVAVPAAAVLVVAAYFGLTTLHNGPAPTTIDAAFYLDDHAALNSTLPFSEGAPLPATLERDETGSDQHWVAVAATMTTADAR
jgi:predicted anti-sigma-YlaC factor YlaD